MLWTTTLQTDLINNEEEFEKLNKMLKRNNISKTVSKPNIKNKLHHKNTIKNLMFFIEHFILKNDVLQII